MTRSCTAAGLDAASANRFGVSMLRTCALGLERRKGAVRRRRRHSAHVHSSRTTLRLRSGIASVRRVAQREDKETLAIVMSIDCAMGLNCDC